MPDGSTPGTQADLRPERPLTRRELRAREAADAPPASATPGALAAQPARVEFPAPPARVEFNGPPAAVEPAAAANPDAPAPAFAEPSPQLAAELRRGAFRHHAGVTLPRTERRRSRRAAEPAADVQPAGIQPGRCAAAPMAARRAGSGRQADTGATRLHPAATRDAHRATRDTHNPVLPETTAALPAKSTTLPATPTAPPKAESTARRRDRDSAFSCVTSRRSSSPESRRAGSTSCSPTSPSTTTRSTPGAVAAGHSGTR